MLNGLVGHGIELPIPKIQRLRFGSIERPRPTAAKNSKLVARFVDGTVAIDSFGNSERRPASACCSD